MKALLICQTAFDGDQLYAGRLSGSTFKRLVVREKNNLTITVHDNKVFVITDFKLHGSYTILREVDVPDELIKKALAFVRAKAKFDALKDTFRALLNP